MWSQISEYVLGHLPGLIGGSIIIPYVTWFIWWSRRKDVEDQKRRHQRQQAPPPPPENNRD